MILYFQSFRLIIENKSYDFAAAAGLIDPILSIGTLLVRLASTSAVLNIPLLQSRTGSRGRTDAADTFAGQCTQGISFWASLLRAFALTGVAVPYLGVSA